MALALSISQYPQANVTAHLISRNSETELQIIKVMSSDAFDAISKKLERSDVNESRQDSPSFGHTEITKQFRLKSNGVLATDITDCFITAVQQLDAGHIVRDQSFTLFESIGALEIMDRKMDSGYLEPGETLEDEFDFLQELLAEEVIGIIDQLQCHEMAWHMGHPLAQTIFTSLHIDRLLSPCPTSIDETRFDRGEDDEPLLNQVLRAYCLGLVKTCCYVNHRISAEYFYQDEDFVTHTHSLSLLENLEITFVLNFLEETLYLIESSNYDENHRSALIIRLRLRIEFLRAVENAESINISSNANNWINLKSMISELKNTVKYGTLVPSAFSGKLQSKLASTVPPRPMVQVLYEDAINHFERLCLDASAAVEVLNYFDCHSFLTFIMLFQSRKPQPSVENYNEAIY